MDRGSCRWETSEETCTDAPTTPILNAWQSLRTAPERSPTSIAWSSRLGASALRAPGQNAQVVEIAYASCVPRHRALRTRGRAICRDLLRIDHISRCGPDCLGVRENLKSTPEDDPARITIIANVSAERADRQHDVPDRRVCGELHHLARRGPFRVSAEIPEEKQTPGNRQRNPEDSVQPVKVSCRFSIARPVLSALKSSSISHRAR